MSKKFLLKFSLDCSLARLQDSIISPDATTEIMICNFKQNCSISDADNFAWKIWRVK